MTDTCDQEHGTHYAACECREEHFRQLAAENARLKAENNALALTALRADLRLQVCHAALLEHLCFCGPDDPDPLAHADYCEYRRTLEREEQAAAQPQP